MKRLYLKFRIFLMTFALGLAFVWFFNNVKPYYKEARGNATIVTIAPKLPRFTKTFRACKPGYVQGYVSNDGFALTEGNSHCEKPKSRDKTVVWRDNLRIISRKIRENSNYVEIYKIDTGHCIESPTIEMGLELEEFIKNNP